MNVVVFGKTGQLALSLAETQPGTIDAIYLSREDCDLLNAGAIEQSLNRLKPDYVINAAAYTAVDQAETETDVAMAINADAPAVMADWVAATNGNLIHISTDFIFDGKRTSPYLPDDEPSPLGSYGRSKLIGEQQIADNAGNNSMIIRTAWLYSEHGRNFVKTMLQLMQTREQLSVVSDQRGCPTYVEGLARTIWQVIVEEKFAAGVYHWTDAGEITWYDFACEIESQALALGILESPTPISAIATTDYPTPAARPAYSVLDSSRLIALTGTQNKPWQTQLSIALERIARQS